MAAVAVVEVMAAEVLLLVVNNSSGADSNNRDEGLSQSNRLVRRYAGEVQDAQNSLVTGGLNAKRA